MQKTDVLSGLKEDAGSDFPQETNLNSMSPDLPSIQAPLLTTMEVDNSSAGAGIHQNDGPADNSDMIYQQNHIDWNTINYYEDDTISQVRMSICCFFLTRHCLHYKHEDPQLLLSLSSEPYICILKS